eukprot:759490-Hanusia_phi.AAC.3
MGRVNNLLKSPATSSCSPPVTWLSACVPARLLFMALLLPRPSAASLHLAHSKLPTPPDPPILAPCTP